MRITPDGAALIAQVLPVGLLILAIEARAVWNISELPERSSSRDRNSRRFWMFNRVSFTVINGLAFLAVLLGGLSVWLCFVSVNEGTDLTGLRAEFVVISSTLVWVLAVGAASSLAMGLGKSHRREFGDAQDED